MERINCSIGSENQSDKWVFVSAFLGETQLNRVMRMSPDPGPKSIDGAEESVAG